jgi:hypothetical protein
MRSFSKKQKDTIMFVIAWEANVPESEPPFSLKQLAFFSCGSYPS